MKNPNRRSFLMQSMAGAAALPLAATPQTANDPVNVAFIGTGGRGTYLLRTTLKVPEARVVAVCDIKPDRLDNAASLAAQHKPNTYTDYRRILERNDVAAVYIATPCDLHVEMAIAALQAGKHVYCEKPIGITPQSIQRLVDEVKASKTVFQVGLGRRSDPGLLEAIPQIQSGKYGQIVYVKAQRHSSNDINHEGSSADWFFFKKRSGDVIVEQSIHNLDVCNWAIGSLPESAAGFGGTLIWKDEPPGRDTMDGYTLSYEYGNGVKLSYTNVFFHPRGMPGAGSYEYVYTTTGAVDLGAKTFYPRERDAEPIVLSEKRRQGDAPHIAAFFACMRTGDKPPADITIGATSALTSILGREAVYQKNVMHWKDFGVRL